jgi:hypothetical protein
MTTIMSAFGWYINLWILASEIYGCWDGCYWLLLVIIGNYRRYASKLSPDYILDMGIWEIMIRYRNLDWVFQYICNG